MNNITVKAKTKEVIKIWSSALADARNSMNKDYVLSVIAFGEKLIEAKEKIAHGGWENFCKSDLKSLRHYHYKNQ